MSKRLTIMHDGPLGEAVVPIGGKTTPRRALMAALEQLVDGLDDHGDELFWEDVRVHAFVVTTGAHAEALKAVWQ